MKFGEAIDRCRSSAIQQFVGSLNERKAKKGIFITSSYFADPVQTFEVKRVNNDFFEE